MNIRSYREFGALNSPKIFDAFEQGAKKIGFFPADPKITIPVIWSVLWSGRMKANQRIYENAVSQGIPVLIIEVGNFKRGVTWRLSVNNVNRLGYFGQGPIDNDRPKKLGIELKPIRLKRRSEILIACQHKQSLQWPNTMSTESWITDTVKKLKTKTDRDIVIRPHPRCAINPNIPGVSINYPRKILNTYDDFDFDTDYHAVINYNTGPAIAAAINGTPVICDQSSLAFPVSDDIDNIEDPRLENREQWLIDLSHKEWTIEEIADGIPQQRLLPYLVSTCS